MGIKTVYLDGELMKKNLFPIMCKQWEDEMSNVKEGIGMTEATKEIYYYLEDRCGGLDVIYEETILALVGSYGLVVLKDAKLLKPYDVLNGRQVYALCDIDSRN